MCESRTTTQKRCHQRRLSKTAWSTTWCESQYRRHTKELFQCKQRKLWNYVIIILYRQCSTIYSYKLWRKPQPHSIKRSKICPSSNYLMHFLPPQSWFILPSNTHTQQSSECFLRWRLQGYLTTKNHDNCSSTNNNKTMEWTLPHGRNQFIDSHANRARPLSII